MIEYRGYPELRTGPAVRAPWKAKLTNIVSPFHRAMR